MSGFFLDAQSQDFLSMSIMAPVGSSFAACDFARWASLCWKDKYLWSSLCGWVLSTPSSPTWRDCAGITTRGTVYLSLCVSLTSFFHFIRLKIKNKNLNLAKSRVMQQMQIKIFRRLPSLMSREVRHNLYKCRPLFVAKKNWNLRFRSTGCAPQSNHIFLACRNVWENFAQKRKRCDLRAILHILCAMEFRLQ